MSKIRPVSAEAPAGDDLRVPAPVLALGAMLLWALYFAVVYSPVGSVFVYANF